jgi:hypothetical protein
MFSESFLQIFIYGALGWTALGAFALIVLFAIDRVRGTLW